MGFMWDPKISLSLYKVGINLLGRFVGGGRCGGGALDCCLGRTSRVNRYAGNGFSTPPEQQQQSIGGETEIERERETPTQTHT